MASEAGGKEGIYVAVGNDIPEGRLCLSWSVKHLAGGGDHKLVILYVHQPASRVKIGFGPTPVSLVGDKQLQPFRQKEEQILLERKTAYVDYCTHDLKVEADTEIIQSTQAAAGIIEKVAQLHIKKLVMGASKLSKTGKEPTSRIASAVCKQADQSCSIFFIHKGTLAYARGASCEGTSQISYKPRHMSSISEPLPYTGPSSLVLEVGACSVHTYNEPNLNFNYTGSTADSSDTISPLDSSGYQHQLQQAYNEAEWTRDVSWLDLCRSAAAEEFMQLKNLENYLHAKHMNAIDNLQIINQSLEEKNQQMHEELMLANTRGEAMELQIENLEITINELEERAIRAEATLEELEQKHRKLQLERENSLAFTEFTYSELVEATYNFDGSNIIGEGGYGTVYRGSVRCTSVAIKRLRPEGFQGEKEFDHEVDILGRMRHPNLVTLIGACKEERALVYEFLPNGSLEDRLQCRNQEQPLPWRDRVRIMTEICSALIFLHTSKPHGIIHGDLKPANVLLSDSDVSKLGDFGLCRLLCRTDSHITPHHHTVVPKGTFAYTDPVYLTTGESTAAIDIYSLGVLMLRVLTGRGPMWLQNPVKAALADGMLHEMLDNSAGEWPLEKAKGLANLALQCCELDRKRRPDLIEVWGVLKATMSMP